MIRAVDRLLDAVGDALVSVAGRRAVRRGTDRLLAGRRTIPGEDALAREVDALGGEVVKLRSRDGLRLTGRWLLAEGGSEGWRPDPYEAILLLHGWSGSIAPDLVEVGPFLRRTAGVLGLDFRGHGGSDDALTTFGLHEIEDVAGALGWLGERGIRRVALVGSSMGGITAIASVVVLGDGSLPAADVDSDAPAAPAPARHPRIVAVVAEAVPPELPVAVANRMRGPRFIRLAFARRLFAEAARRLGGDPRATEPIRVVALVEPVPLLLVQDEADTTVPVAEGRRLAEEAGPSADHWVIAGAGHGAGHSTAPGAYEARISEFLRAAFAGARDPAAILAANDPIDAQTSRKGG